jgi:predicted nucleic acid-binding protein
VSTASPSGQYLVDSSAWIEYIRGTGSQAHLEVRDLVERDFPAAVITEPVIMELLAGARDAADFRKLDELTSGMPLCQIDPVCDYAEAAAIYKLGRNAGRTIRSMTGCLIAAVAMRREATVMHADADFDAITSYAPLRVRSLL